MDNTCKPIKTIKISEIESRIIINYRETLENFYNNFEVSIPENETVKTFVTVQE